MPSISDIKPLDHAKIFNSKNQPRRRDLTGKIESSIDLGESSEALENRTEDESTSSHLFNRNPSSAVQGKRVCKSNNETIKALNSNQLKNSGKKSAKELPKNISDSMGGLTPAEGGQRYFSMAEEAGLLPDSAVLESKNKAIMLLNMGNTSMEAESNGSSAHVNNKNHRKLKKINQSANNEGKPDTAFIEDNTFLQSQSFFNEN